MSNIIYSAGVLFYCKCKDGNVYFLLGREYDNKWSDFGGKSEPKDKYEIENTASREAWEESLGCVFSQEDIRSTLKYKKTPFIRAKTQGGHPYYMYLLKIPYSMNYRSIFNSTRSFISKTDIDRRYLEKFDIRWVSLETLKYTITGKGLISLRTIFENTIKQHMEEIETIIKM
jgi:hypothetical protein